MPPVPKKKHTRSRSNTRRIGVRLNLSHMHPCPKCGKMTFSHQACASCGYSYQK